MDERMARNSTERGAWWQVRSGIERIHFFLPTKSEVGINTASGIEIFDIMLVLKLMVFLHNFIWRLIILIAF